MRRHRLRGLFTWLVGAACIVLAWVIYDEIGELPTGGVPDSAVAVPSAALEPLPPQAAMVIPNKAAVAVIVDRPVFSQTRRPGRAPADGGSATSMDFTLLGVVITEGEPSALVRPGKGGVIQQLKVGDDVAGWTVEEIAPDRLIIRRDTVEAEVFLDYAAPAPPMPRPVIRKEKPAAAERAPQRAAEQAPKPDADSEAGPDGEGEN